ncbi:MAG: ring-cleaving dioxygenase [Bryobacterales bacterium]|jgi:glyoxalase family protein|nr:ring-cleaving dioxygenase [Bryobacterales bacterium]
MQPFIAGIHHVTAIASDPKRNVAYYEQQLGLRLVKTTVNFDDPGAYHLYYGDDAGVPGTILTFFPWPGATPGRAGTGMTMATAFQVAPGAVDFWMGRFADRALDFEAPVERFGQRVLPFRDPDGMPLELVEHAPASISPVTPGRVSAHSGIPVEMAIHGFHGVSLCVPSADATGRLLTEVFGYQSAGQQGDRYRFVSPEAGIGASVDLVCTSGELVRGRSGAGTVHHVAFRARTNEEQLTWREHLLQAGYSPTPVLDRNYFQSIYFREPGGVLFEIATDPPGFTADEDLDSLGSALKLPAWLEPRRESIAARLPGLR